MIFLLGVLLWAEFLPAVRGGSEQIAMRLHVSVKNYSVSEISFVDALIKVAGEFQIPMGLEWVRDEAPLHGVNLTLRNTSLRGVIASLVKSQAGYGFETRDGVIHIFRRDLLRDRRNFLNLNVAKFQAQNELGGMVDRRLRFLVKRTVSPPPPVPAGAGEAGSYAGPVDERRINLQVENAAVRDVLDRLVLLSDYKVWVVTFSADSTPTPTGFRRTTTLWGKGPVPDSQQPVWELLVWGQLPSLPVRKTTSSLRERSEGSLRWDYVRHRRMSLALDLRHHPRGIELPKASQSRASRGTFCSDLLISGGEVAQELGNILEHGP